MTIKIENMSQLKRNDQFIELVQQLWSAEKMLTIAMPGMIEKAHHLGLKKNIAIHLAETDQHKEALAAIAKQLDFDVDGSENTELKTMLASGEQATGGNSDAAIIRTAIQVEEYEMKKYEELGSLARNLGYEGIARRLFLTYEEERQTNTKLHFLFKTIVAQTAAIGELPV
jgi:ferritin-like metal-binding protein YciE